MAEPVHTPVPERADDSRLKQMYGKLPTRADILKSQMKQRRYFDSGDYALSKAGKPAECGSEHPVPERIPHLEAAKANSKYSPVRRASCLGPRPDKLHPDKPTDVASQR